MTVPEKRSVLFSLIFTLSFLLVFAVVLFFGGNDHAEKIKNLNIVFLPLEKKDFAEEKGSDPLKKIPGKKNTDLKNAVEKTPAKSSEPLKEKENAEPFGHAEKSGSLLDFGASGILNEKEDEKSGLNEPEVLAEKQVLENGDGLLPACEDDSFRKSAESDAGTGMNSIMMADGNFRVLLYPENPELHISRKNESLVDSSREVTVSFTILADGTILYSSIKITPSALLHARIQDEIKKQLMLWKFSADEKGRNGSASFNFSLEIR